MSTRAIAGVVGAGQTQVRRDLVGEPYGSPDPTVDRETGEVSETHPSDVEARGEVTPTEMVRCAEWSLEGNLSRANVVRTAT